MKVASFCRTGRGKQQVKAFEFTKPERRAVWLSAIIKNQMQLYLAA
jgi:hypothetical protein